MSRTALFLLFFVMYGVTVHPLLCPTVLHAETMFAVAAQPVGRNYALYRFDTDNPAKLKSETVISGIQGFGVPTHIEFRPTDGALYLLTHNRFSVNLLSWDLYSVSLETGVATFVNTILDLNVASDGAHSVTDFEFVPTSNGLRLRSTKSSHLNFRVNPDSGDILGIDSALAYAPADAHVGETPDVACMAYDNNSATATSTTLFAMDAAVDQLITIGSTGGSPDTANSGLLHTVGTLGSSFDFCVMDISSFSGNIYAVFTGSGVPILSRIPATAPHTPVSLGAIETPSDTVIDIATPIVETTNPSAQISSPARRGTFGTTDRRVLFRGTASDNFLLDRVVYRTTYNGVTSAYKNASGTTSWRFNVRPKLGRTKVEVKAIDIFGNESNRRRVTILRQ